MGLLLDYNAFSITKQKIQESRARNGGRLIVSGVLQRADVRNHNGRVYPMNILEREVNKYQDEFVGQKRALGELDHPDSSVVNLNNVSHNVLKMWWEGKALLGDVEILSTPAGKILEELLNCGITLGISSRGVGTVKEVFSEGNHSTEVQDDFELIAFDFVSNPSTHGAFMQPSQLGESVQRMDPNLQIYANSHKIVSEIICDLGCKCSI